MKLIAVETDVGHSRVPHTKGGETVEQMTYLLRRYCLKAPDSAVF